MKKRAVLLTIGLALLTAAALLLLPRQQREAESPIDAAITRERAKVVETEATEPPEETEAYAPPVDFEALQAVNPDIIAWLDIPGTDISYPILRHDTDNEFYLSHAENRGHSEAGAIYVEDYNSRELDDPALAVYGHHLRNGAYFGNLQNIYETADGFQNHRDIWIYLPQREIHFRVFAAVPYNDTHLLYTYHFGNPLEYDQFVERILAVRSLNAQIDSTEAPRNQEQLLILSTCLKADNRQRYLVIGAAKEHS